MRILCVGGGSGGHVTPVAAIVSEIRKIHPKAKIEFITDKRYFKHSRELLKDMNVKVVTVSAGKFRRYANLTWKDQFRHIFISYIPNFFDMFRFGFGIIQSYFKIRSFEPDVVFIKGGYVGLPVGLAAEKFFRKIPIVLHDSDAHPGLTNRILSKYATKIGVGMPLEFSEYDKSKTEFVGVPIAESYGADYSSARPEKTAPPLVFVIGGSQGSKTLNSVVLEEAPKFVGRADFLLISGEENYEKISSESREIENLDIKPFVTDEEVSELMKRAEIVITRAGATTMAEIAAVGVASIIVPSPYLASDHQTKNAEIFNGSEAAFVVHENEIDDGKLSKKIDILLSDKYLREKFAKNVKKFGKPNAAKRMAEIITGVVDEKVSK